MTALIIYLARRIVSDAQHGYELMVLHTGPQPCAGLAYFTRFELMRFCPSINNRFGFTSFLL